MMLSRVLSSLRRAVVVGLFCAVAPALASAPVATLSQPEGSAVMASTLVMPSWFAGSRPVAEAAPALAALADAPAHGLEPTDYRVNELVAAFESAARNGVAPAVAAQLDAELTAALERYLTDLNQGRLGPETLKYRFKAPAAPPFQARAYLLQARVAGQLAQALQAAEPQTPMYRAIRLAMAEYRAMGNHPAWAQDLAPLPARSLKPGQAYVGMPLLAQRLMALGDLPAQAALPERYEGPVVVAVERFQRRHGLEPDGVLGPATLAQLKVSPAERVAQMALTLERLRWTPLAHGPRMIVVNVPEFILRAYELQGQQVKLHLEMRVVVGRALDTRTPIFLEEMRFIEFSPYWNVPPSIARSETLPRLRREPAYFERMGFEFVTRDGAVVNALTPEAIEAVQRGEWRIRQRPGPANALGDIKFILPNDQNIFLHHTSSPQLFSRVRRDFSHGCIRIEAPVALAQFVLQDQPTWTAQRIEDAMSAGESRTLRLAQPVPVLIAYSTVVVKDGGTVHFFPDIYQQDARLEQALQSARPRLP